MDMKSDRLTEIRSNIQLNTGYPAGPRPAIRPGRDQFLNFKPAKPRMKEENRLFDQSLIMNNFLRGFLLLTR